MGKIFYIMGKSATGKDTIYEELLEHRGLGLRPLIMYTTRPIRANEMDGVQYHFTDVEGLRQMQSEGRVIELRSYNTVHGTILQQTGMTLTLKSRAVLHLGHWSRIRKCALIMAGNMCFRST